MSKTIFLNKSTKSNDDNFILDHLDFSSSEKYKIIDDYKVADIIILNLKNSTTLVNILTSTDYNSSNKNQLIIALSSIMTWNETLTSKNIYKENHYKKRLCSIKYQSLKVLETKLLTSSHLQCLIIATGFIYGLGEYHLHSLFRTAWLATINQQDISLNSLLIPSQSKFKKKN